MLHLQCIAGHIASLNVLLLWWRPQYQHQVAKNIKYYLKTQTGFFVFFLKKPNGAFMSICCHLCLVLF